MTQNQGIDYGMGKTNIDSETGIRFGVIHHSEVGAAWYDSAEADYGKPTCPKCGNEAIDLEAAEACEVRNADGKLITADEIDHWDDDEHDTSDYACVSCEYCFGASSAFSEEPSHFFIDTEEYKAFQSGDDSDIFIEKAPYFTYAQFCSPCAPGAVYLVNPLETPNENNRGYCFGHDWFWDTETKRAPYPVFSVETGEIVKPV